jgi:hypothetical protein
LPTTCGVGACSADGATSCVAGIVEDSCSAGAPALDDATCDGIDDDCDGIADEDYMSMPTTCGVGACSAGGATSCVAGVVEDSCSAGAPAPDDATCDGIDDDCDGITDEDYLSMPTTCGVGACSADGATSCVAGVVEDSCSAGAPALDDATCDGIDDDCDGIDDEDYLPVPSSCGVGACVAAGITSCEAGVVQGNCEPAPPGTETCDGLDNDCDGMTDEGDALDAAIWYGDLDGDTYGDPSNSVPACSRPAGFVSNAGDCNDSNVNTYPGASEFNDGEDNQCPGDPGFGLVDELGEAGFFDPSNDARYSWQPQAGVSSYETLRSGIRDFSSACTAFVTSNSVVFDGATPGGGQVFYYLVRTLSPYTGSLGRGQGIERGVTCP